MTWMSPPVMTEVQWAPSSAVARAVEGGRLRPDVDGALVAGRGGDVPDDLTANAARLPGYPAVLRDVDAILGAGKDAPVRCFQRPDLVPGQAVDRLGGARAVGHEHAVARPNQQRHRHPPLATAGAPSAPQPDELSASAARSTTDPTVHYPPAAAACQGSAQPAT